MLTLLTLLVCLQLQPPVLSVSCDCELIRVTASGGAAEHQHRFLGEQRFRLRGKSDCKLPS